MFYTTKNATSTNLNRRVLGARFDPTKTMLTVL